MSLGQIASLFVLLFVPWMIVSFCAPQASQGRCGVCGRKLQGGEGSVCRGCRVSRLGKAPPRARLLRAPGASAREGRRCVLCRDRLPEDSLTVCIACARSTLRQRDRDRLLSRASGSTQQGPALPGSAPVIRALRLRGARSASRCPLCLDALEALPARACPACSTATHVLCRAESGAGCPTLGCDEQPQAARDPQPAPPGREEPHGPLRPQARARPRPRRAWVMPPPLPGEAAPPTRRRAASA